MYSMDTCAIVTIFYADGIMLDCTREKRPAAMSRSLNRQHCRPVCALYSAMPSALLAAVIVTYLSGSLCEAWAQEEQLSTTSEVDHQILIHEHAG